ncbi:MAG: MFS transporter [Gammaproteobacteria bacterium]
MITNQHRRLLILSSLGGALEYFDFIIYILLAPLIEKIFFAYNDAYIASLKTLAIFSLGYLLRPLGGMIFSSLGDKYGRKTIFLLTITLMAIPSFAISLLPTPAQIGSLSPILLLIFRMMQGLALGGEIPAAITFVAEHTQTTKRSLALSTLFLGINIGLLLGSLLLALLTSTLSSSEMLTVGWRIPFFIGGVFGLIALFLRRHLHETGAFATLKKQDIARIPLLVVLKSAWRNVLLGMALVSAGAVSVFVYLYWPHYLSEYMHYDYSQLIRITTISTLICSIVMLLGGYLADKIGPRQFYLKITAALALLAYPLFLLFSSNNMTLVLVAYALFSILFGMLPGAYCAILSTLFPTPIRYSGIALSFNLAYAILGGLSPLICTYIIHRFDSILAPAYYIILMAVISWIACYKIGRYNKEDLELTVDAVVA